jgi:hypothetical protein
MNSELTRVDRREALKWIAAAVAAFPALDWNAMGAAENITRTLTDPDLLNPVVLWNRTLTAAELKTVTALCDVIIPADDHSPGAGAVKVQDFIDEWVSAPYPMQKADQKLIRQGLAWLDEESKKRFSKPFAELSDVQKTAICDQICFVPKARPELKNAALFFARFRDLTATGFYTTKEGMKDLKYIGNVAMATFDGPPPAVLKHLGLS